MADKMSMVRMIGSSSHSKEEREENDFYATDPETVDLFYQKFYADGQTISSHVWECACGDGAISKNLRLKGHNVFSTDIISRKGEAIWTLDFLKSTLQYSGDIITNPPYKYAQKFIEKAIQSVRPGDKVIMFLRLQFLEGKKRHKLFRKHPPKYVYVHSSRQQTYKNNDPAYKLKSSAICYAWFVWEKGSDTETLIRWIK
jgi:hypothetical protein